MNKKYKICSCGIRRGNFSGENFPDKLARFMKIWKHNVVGMTRDRLVQSSPNFEEEALV